MCIMFIKHITQTIQSQQFLFKIKMYTVKVKSVIYKWSLNLVDILKIKLYSTTDYPN